MQNMIARAYRTIPEDIDPGPGFVDDTGSGQTELFHSTNDLQSLSGPADWTRQGLQVVGAVKEFRLA